MTKAVKAWIADNQRSGFFKGALMLFLEMFWLYILQGTDAYYGVYVFCALCASACACGNLSGKRRLSKKAGVCAGAAAFLFACAVILAEYRIFVPVSTSVKLLLPAFAGGFLTAWNILAFLFTHTGDNFYLRPDRFSHKRAWVLFVIAFATIVLVDSVYFFGSAYPGVLTADSLDQMEMILHHSYYNHHPFYHTLVIRICVGIGMVLFHEINAAVAVFSVFQILFMAAVFAFALMTMYQAGVPLVIVAVSFLAYAGAPFHISNSVTMWKDVLFGGAVLLYIIMLLRIFRELGSRRVNYAIYVFSCLAFGLWRSNGLFALIVTMLVMLVLRKESRRLILITAASVMVCLILKYPILGMLHVPQPDTAEALSIPEQQIARVIVDGEGLAEDEISELRKFYDYDSVPTAYRSYISDYIKQNVRSKGYLDDHKGEFLKLWLRIGLRHPAQYLEAWVDETRGFWNAGYQYGVVYNVNIDANDFGIENTIRSERLREEYLNRFHKFSTRNYYELFRSIGLHVWIIAACMLTALAHKRREFLLSVPPLAIVLTLMISTPVFAEFRYAYSVFTTFPVILGISLWGIRQPETNGGRIA